jgi:hypothetical protein
VIQLPHTTVAHCQLLIQQFKYSQQPHNTRV